MVFTDIAGERFIRLPLIVAAIALGAAAARRALLGLAPKALGQAAAARCAAWSSAGSSAGLVAIVAGLLRAGDFWRAYPLGLLSRRLCRPAGGDGGDLGALGPRVDRERMRAAAWLLILIFGAALSLAFLERRSSS